MPVPEGPPDTERSGRSVTIDDTPRVLAEARAFAGPPDALRSSERRAPDYHRTCDSKVAASSTLQ